MMPFSPIAMARAPQLRQGDPVRQHSISLNGIAFRPHISGALHAPDLRMLLVADLHLEQGASLARRGVHVPPYDTSATIAQLESVVAETRPWRLVLLGDSFHDRVAHADLPGDQRERLLALTAAVETIWITGNHDPEAPQGLGGTCVECFHVEGIDLRHIPSRRLAGHCEVSGHLHPGAAVVHRGIATRAKCFVADGKRLILPAFGAYTGAVNVRSASFTGLFRENDAHVWMIGSAAIHKFPLSRVS